MVFTTRSLILRHADIRLIISKPATNQAMLRSRTLRIPCWSTQSRDTSIVAHPQVRSAKIDSRHQPRHEPVKRALPPERPPRSRIPPLGSESYSFALRLEEMLVRAWLGTMPLERAAFKWLLWRPECCHALHTYQHH